MAKITPEDDLAFRAAETFAGLSMVDRLGELSPRLAYAGIKAMSDRPAAAAQFLPELRVLPDAGGVLTDMYDRARVDYATAGLVEAGTTVRRERRGRQLAAWSRRLGVPEAEAASIMDSGKEDRTTVEARARLYR